MNLPCYLFGGHDGEAAGLQRLLQTNGRTGWVVVPIAVGANPADEGGYDFRPLIAQGLGVLARLDHGYHGAGTIPLPEHYGDFALRIARFVVNSPGIRDVAAILIGNEPNHPVERPRQQGEAEGEPITPAMYARCFGLVSVAVTQAGFGDVPLCMAPVAPWCAETRWPANPSGDWLVYTQDCILGILARDVPLPAVAIHCYTHGSDPGLVTEAASRMEPPFEQYTFNFQHYRQQMKVLEDTFPPIREVAVYMTEVDQTEAWADANFGWVRAVYAELNAFNEQAWDHGKLQIRTACLFRWLDGLDRWGFEHKMGVQEDMRQAMAHDYVWRDDMGPAQWVERHRDRLEEPFHDPLGVPEVTVPAKHMVTWDKDLPCPEMDAKIKPQPEVYEGEQSAVGFHRFAKFRWWCYTDEPILVVPRQRTRAIAALMVVAHGVGGDPNVAGNCGMRVGLSEYVITEPTSAEIAWSDWWVVRDNLDNENLWTTAFTSEMVPISSQVRVWIQCNADVAADISAGHWDLEIVEQYDTDEPPPSGNCQEEADAIADGLIALAERVRNLPTVCGSRNVEACMAASRLAIDVEVLQHFLGCGG